MKEKAARSVQRWLLQLLAHLVRRGYRPQERDVASFLSGMANAQPELATAVAANLAQEHSANAQLLLRGLLGDASRQATGQDDIDRLINFSAFWRDEWVARKAAEVPAGARVLDAGAGQCRYKPLFAHTDYKAQDFAQYEGSDDGPLQETWNYGAIDYVCDITEIPVASGSFDVVLCTEVLEHVPNPVLALRELARVTAPGGRLLLTAPLGSGVHQEPYHFYGGFSAYFYQRFLEEYGCEVIETRPLGGLLRHVAQEVHRTGRTFAEHGRSLTPEQQYVVMDWLPRVLSGADDDCFVEQFTVGYMVEARKRAMA